MFGEDNSFQSPFEKNADNSNILISYSLTIMWNVMHNCGDKFNFKPA